MLQEKVVGEIKIRILAAVALFSPENREVYEIMWKNIVESDRPQMAV